MVIVPLELDNPTELPLSPMYDNLDLMGHVEVGASNTDLDAALKKLVDDAMAPLARLDAEQEAAHRVAGK